MTQPAIPQQPSRTAATLGLAVLQAVGLGGAFQLIGMVGEVSASTAMLALCAVGRLLILVALTRAVWRLGAFCLPALAASRRTGVKTEILGEDIPI